LALVPVARANAFPELKDGLLPSKMQPDLRGATLMRVDLQQVDAEIAVLRSKLAAIDDDLDECRRGYFEHPWAWSQMRRALTSERHLMQRRLDEFTFARECVGGRKSPHTATPSFHSLANRGERDVDLARLTFRLIQGGRS
jgi:hypothetical protein